MVTDLEPLGDRIRVLADVSGHHMAAEITPAAVTDLAQGETLTLHYNVTTTDPFGATATQDVAITITGVNDAPTVAAAVTGAGNEGSGSFTVPNATWFRSTANGTP